MPNRGKAPEVDVDHPQIARESVATLRHHPLSSACCASNTDEDTQFEKLTRDGTEATNFSSFKDRLCGWRSMRLPQVWHADERASPGSVAKKIRATFSEIL